MVQFRYGGQPAWMRDPTLSAVQSEITFAPVDDSFVSKHSKPNVAVKVRRGTGKDHRLKLLLFRTPIHEDSDGAPYTYAPPRSATDTRPVAGLEPPPPGGKTDNIYNATDKYHYTGHALEKFLETHKADDPALTTFQNDGKNNFTWTGVSSAAAGANVDNRLFLRDVNKNFPIKQTAGKWKGYYRSQSAIGAKGGGGVNAFEVAYAARSGAMKTAGVQLGDFGIAFNAANGRFTPFVYADAAGDKSSSVGEFSSKAMEALDVAGDEGEIMVLVFPGTAVGKTIDPDRIAMNVDLQMKRLRNYSNADDVISELVGYDTRFVSDKPPSWKALKSVQHERLATIFRQYGIDV